MQGCCFEAAAREGARQTAWAAVKESAEVAMRDRESSTS